MKNIEVDRATVKGLTVLGSVRPRVLIDKDNFEVRDIKTPRYTSYYSSLQNAIDDLPTNTTDVRKHGMLYHPAETKFMTGQVVFPAFMTLAGAHMQSSIFDFSRDLSSGTQAAFVLQNQEDLVNYPGEGGAMVGYWNFRDFKLLGTIANTRSAMKNRSTAEIFGGFNKAEFRRVRFANWGTTIIDFIGAGIGTRSGWISFLRFRDIELVNTKANCINLRGGAAIDIRDSELSQAQNTSIVMYGLYSSIVDRCTIEVCGQGLNVAGGAGLTISNCYFENITYLMSAAGYCRAGVLSGNYGYDVHYGAAFENCPEWLVFNNFFQGNWTQGHRITGWMRGFRAFNNTNFHFTTGSVRPWTATALTAWPASIEESYGGVDSPGSLSPAKIVMGNQDLLGGYFTMRTKTGAGAPTDGTTFGSRAGLMVFNQTDNKIYVRGSYQWKSIN